jgi:hypothetical protein
MRRWGKQATMRTRENDKVDESYLTLFVEFGISKLLAL